jgi:RNA polymerase sigma-70 factor (ECF subfamily)
VRATRSQQTLTEPPGYDDGDGAGCSSETALLRRLRCGDEAAFAALVERHHPAMVRLARAYVPSREVAEDVAQEAWLGLLRGIDAFEGRSSLRTWLYRIVVNRAVSAGRHEHRHHHVDDGQLADDEHRFTADGWWVTPPVHWADEVVERIAAGAVAERIRDVICELPSGQRQVVSLRDVEGLTSGEVCAILGITDGNQRVLLHRARARIRALLDREVTA